VEEKYIKNHSWQIGCPLQHMGTFVERDLNNNGQVKSRKVAFLLKNIGTNNIFAYKGIILTKDAFNQPLKSVPFKLSEIEEFSVGTLYGNDQFYSVPKDATNFEIQINTIVFSDSKIIEVDDHQFLNLNEIKTSLPFPDLKKIWPIYVKDFKLTNSPLITDDYILCGCGAINLSKAKKCADCNIKVSTLKEMNSKENIEKLLNDNADKVFNKVTKSLQRNLSFTKEDLDNFSEAPSKRLKELKKVLSDFKTLEKESQKLNTLELKILTSHSSYKEYLKSIKLIESEIQFQENKLVANREKKLKESIELRQLEIENHLINRNFKALRNLLTIYAKILIKHPMIGAWELFAEFEVSNDEEFINQSRPIEEKRKIISSQAYSLIKKSRKPHKLLRHLKVLEADIILYDQKKKKRTEVLLIVIILGILSILAFFAYIGLI